MTESRIARKYATALFFTAKKSKHVDTISHDLKVISSLLKENPVIKNLLEAPHISEIEKKELISSTFQSQISEALFSFLILVIEKHRIQYLHAMANELERLFKEDQGIVKARLITARSVDQKLSDEIQHQLEKSTHKIVEMTQETEPRLIGGIVIVVGDKIIDRSIRYQLNQFKEQMSTLRVY